MQFDFAKSAVPQPVFAPLLRFALLTTFQICGGITWTGVENIPMSGPVIFCPNHISDCDPCAVYVSTPRRDIYFMAKSELFEIPILGRMIRAFGTFPVKRDSADRASIRRAEAILNAGNSLVIFPEGQLSETGKLIELQPGAAMIALRTGATIVPVGLVRTNLVLPYAEVVPRHSPLHVRVVYGMPISVEPFEGMKSKVAIPLVNERIEREMRRVTGQ